MLLISQDMNCCYISGPPSLQGKYPQRRGEGGRAGKGGPLWSPAIPLKDGKPHLYIKLYVGVKANVKQEVPRAELMAFNKRDVQVFLMSHHLCRGAARASPPGFPTSIV